MLLNVALFCGLLFVPAALGHPSGLAARITRRREGRRSQVSNHLDPVDGSDFNASAIDNTVYNPSWAGAVWSESNGTFTSVVGTFTVPAPSGANGTFASAWVGIDGYSCYTGHLLTGVDFTVSSHGQPTYDAWWESDPDYLHDFSNLSISAGDTIELSITVYSMNSGFAKIQNKSNGQTVSTHASLGSSASLCGQNAEWIVQDFVLDGSIIPLGNVTFTNAVASGPGNTTYTPSGAAILDIRQNNKILTSVSTDGSSVTIKML